MKDSKSFNFVTCLFQLLVWTSLIVVICAYNSSSINRIITISIFCSVYVIYIAMEFCSDVLKYICSKTNQSGIFEKLGQFYSSYPVIKFDCECYHYKYQKVRGLRRGRKGGVSMHSVRVISYKDTLIFPYYSGRDVSGLFYLNCDNPESKYYVQLEIEEEINFADTISYMDYEKTKDRFWRKNVFKDKLFYFKESRYLPDLEKEILVKINDSEPCLVNCFWYFIFTMLTLTEIYKFYFNSLCVKQKYKIRKLISTRYDLNQQIYNNFIPQIDVISRQQSYDENYYNYINNDYKLKLPTAEELEKSEKYKKNIPKYKLSKGGKESHAGVIIDDPEILVFDSNKPPETFDLMKGHVNKNKNKKLKKKTTLELLA